jgi:FAD/FMN-containing dehydrogenase
MAESGATLLARLAAVVGPGHVLTAPADTEPFLVDWRGRYRGATRAVVRAGCTAEVAAVVRACAQASVPIVPQGGNTGMCGGATPHADGREIVLALSRMSRVRAVDAANATITVEAGVTLHAVQQAAADAGLYFPLSLASEGSCTIGGNLSTNAGGTAVLRFGNTRDLTLGLEVVLADGQVWNGLRGLRKDNTGYDLKHLFIGAEGTLGVVTAAVLKLYPAPKTRVTALTAVRDVATAIRLLSDLRQALGDRITGFELMSAYSLALSRKHHPTLPNPCPGSPWYVLLQVDDNAADSGTPAQVERALWTLIYADHHK